jgi:hypothetical protein
MIVRQTLPKWDWNGRSVASQDVSITVTVLSDSQMLSTKSTAGDVKQMSLDLSGSIAMGMGSWDSLTDKLTTPYFIERATLDVQVGNYVAMIAHAPVGTVENEVSTGTIGLTAQGGVFGKEPILTLGLSASDSTSYTVTQYGYSDESFTTSTSHGELYSGEYLLKYVTSRKGLIQADNPAYDRTNRDGVMFNPAGLNVPPSIGHSSFPLVHQSIWQTFDETGLSSINTVLVRVSVDAVAFAQNGTDVKHTTQRFGGQWTFDVDLSQIGVEP